MVRPVRSCLATWFVWKYQNRKKVLSTAMRRSDLKDIILQRYVVAELRKGQLMCWMRQRKMRVPVMQLKSNVKCTRWNCKFTGLPTLASCHLKSSFLFAQHVTPVQSYAVWRRWNKTTRNRAKNTTACILSSSWARAQTQRSLIQFKWSSLYS